MSEQNYMLDQLESKNKEAGRYRHKMKEYKTKFEELQKQYDQMKSEFEGLKSQASPVEELTKLKAELAKRDHRSAFDRHASELGVNKDAVEAVWRLSDYKVDGSVNDDVIKAAISKTLESNPYLKSQPVLQAGPGLSKGGQADALNKKQVSRANFDDPIWQMQNQWYMQAAAAGELEIIG